MTIDRLPIAWRVEYLVDHPRGSARRWPPTFGGLIGGPVRDDVLVVPSVTMDEAERMVFVRVQAKGHAWCAITSVTRATDLEDHARELISEALNKAQRDSRKGKK